MDDPVALLEQGAEDPQVITALETSDEYEPDREYESRVFTFYRTDMKINDAWKYDHVAGKQSVLYHPDSEEFEIRRVPLRERVKEQVKTALQDIYSHCRELGRQGADTYTVEQHTYLLHDGDIDQYRSFLDENGFEREDGTYRDRDIEIEIEEEHPDSTRYGTVTVTTPGPVPGSELLSGHKKRHKILQDGDTVINATYTDQHPLQ